MVTHRFTELHMQDQHRRVITFLNLRANTRTVIAIGLGSRLCLIARMPGQSPHITPRLRLKLTDKGLNIGLHIGIGRFDTHIQLGPGRTGKKHQSEG